VVNPEEMLPRLFEKFATKDVGDSAKHGTDLGLYISKAIVKAHNGKLLRLIILKVEPLLLSLCQQNQEDKRIVSFKDKTTKRNNKYSFP
jgi:signal transduction histidine kinase